MKTNVLLAMALGFLAGPTFGTESPSTYEACSQILQDADKAGEKITPIQIAAVVSVANAECLSYAETSEWLNEELFAILLIRPGDFLENFSSAEPAVKQNIVAELENPVNDSIDLQKAYRSILGVKSISADKETILSAIRSSGDNMGLKFEK